MDNTLGKSKADIIYEQIRLDLINHKYSVNDVLNEQSLAGVYEVSKTPVREALSKLVEEGFLEKFPRFGYVVRDLKLNEYYQIAQLRYFLESGGIIQIIDNVPTERIKALEKLVKKTYVPFEDYPVENRNFHIALAGLLDNPYYVEEVTRVLTWLNRDLSKSFYDRVKGDIHINHRALIDAMVQRDKTKAIEVLESELTRSDDNFHFSDSTKSFHKKTN